MEAIREIVKVKNRQVIINLPDDFNADEVEVIVLKVIVLKTIENEIPQWHINEVRERTSEYLKNPDIALDFDEAVKDIENEL